MFLSLTIIAVIAIALVSALLIGIVLIQQAKGGGFGVAFGGIGETVFGAHAASHLIKLTVTLMILFFVFIIGMALLVGHRDSNETAAERYLKDNKVTATDSGLSIRADTSVVIPVADTKTVL